MNFGERAAARRRVKDLKNELKGLRGPLLAVECDKAQVQGYLRDLQETLELGESLKTAYKKAGQHLSLAREAIFKLLDCMSESPEDEVRVSLKELLGDLDQVYHDCSIREDDLDFQSTIRSLKRLSEQYSQNMEGMSKVMLRSELENVKAVLDDAADWRAPDFFALAYYVLHEDRTALKDMENEQRNQCVLSYLNERYMDAFMEQCARAGIKEQVKALIESYIDGE